MKNKRTAKMNHSAQTSADRTFREETLERLTALENGQQGLQRQVGEINTLMRERVEGIQISLGSRIEDTQAAIANQMEVNHKALMAGMEFSRREVGQRIVRIEVNDAKQDLAIEKLDRWYNRGAGAMTAVGGLLAIIAALIYHILVSTGH